MTVDLKLVSIHRSVEVHRFLENHAFLWKIFAFSLKTLARTFNNYLLFNKSSDSLLKKSENKKRKRKRIESVTKLEFFYLQNSGTNDIIKMSCFSKFFKTYKSFDLPVFETTPEPDSKVISTIFTFLRFTCAPNTVWERTYLK